MKSMTNRQIKDQLFEQVARLTKAVSSPKRLELIELLAQAPKTVEMLATETELSVALTSAHLKALKHANLVSVVQEGKYRRYHLANENVSALWVILHQLAKAQFVSLQQGLKENTASTLEQQWVPKDWSSLLEKSAQKNILLIDVRPENEYLADHLPTAISYPLDQLPLRLNELNRDIPIIAYCRGPFCLYARDAVQLLQKQGFHAAQWTDGIAEYHYEQV